MKKAVKVIIPSILLGYLFFKVLGDREALEGYLYKANYRMVALSFFVSLLVYPEGAFGWYAIVRKIKKVSFKETYPIWSISNTSRYIPGTVWQYVGRVEMSRKIGLERKQSAASILIEIMLVMASASILSLFSMGLFLGRQTDFPYWVLLIPFGLFVFHPKIINYVITILARFTRREPFQVENIISIRELVGIIPWFMANFIINGVSIYLLSVAFGPVSLDYLFTFIGIYSLSWLVGYISIFAPGGIGVTEASLTFLLSFILPLPLGAAVAIIYRIFLSIGELANFVVSLRFFYEKR